MNVFFPRKSGTGGSISAGIQAIIHLSILNKSMKNIPYVAIDRQHRGIKTELMAVVSDVFDSGQFILGDRVSEFEQHMAVLIGVRFAAGVNSGTDALVLALKALGVGPGDEVITVPNTFVSTVSSIVLAGAEPRFVDVRHDLNMDPDKLVEAVTERTRAIIPVHYGGCPCYHIMALKEIADDHDLLLIEDGAEALGSKIDNRMVGSFGHSAMFSFCQNKVITTGEGGVMVTDDEKTYKNLQLIHPSKLEHKPTDQHRDQFEF